VLAQFLSQFPCREDFQYLIFGFDLLFRLAEHAAEFLVAEAVFWSPVTALSPFVISLFLFSAIKASGPPLRESVSFHSQLLDLVLDLSLFMGLRCLCRCFALGRPARVRFQPV
jgi:hypothetical protein